jgi:hypothetical protein
MAILSITLIEATENSVAYKVVEDGNAADTVQRDVLADLTAGSAIHTALNAAVADQAAAQALTDSSIDVSSRLESSVPAGATAGAQLLLTPNVSGAGVGAYRMDFSSVKAAAGDTQTSVQRLSLRHSAID